MEQECGFTVCDVPGKGKGIIAQRQYARGETVLAEAPLFTLGADELQDAPTVIRGALSQCTPTQCEAFYDLYNGHPGAPHESGIFQTNVLPCGTNDPNTRHRAMKGGVFLIGSRFNSSCVPNVNNTWDEKTGRLVFRAVRDLGAGEELCIAYGNVLATRDERCRELKAKFRFVCECETCSLTGQALEESDFRRACLGDMYRDHARGSVPGDPMEALGEAMLALRYLREEGLVVHASAFYRTGFTLCAAVSDYANAKAWAKKAYDLSCVAYGERRADIWKVLAEDPSIYEEAGTQGHRTLAGPDARAWSYLGLI